MKHLLILFSTLTSTACFAQKDSIYRPSSLREMFMQMDNALGPAAIQAIKTISEDSIKRTNPYTKDLIKGYDYYNDSKVITDLEEKQINYDDRYQLLMISYHRYLNGEDLNLKDQYKYYDSLLVLREKAYEAVLQKDSIDGRYIPSSLVDCFIELDKILPANTIQLIKKTDMGRLHLTVGMSIRNRWGLWSGSRLKKYFLDRNAFMHPDSMSTVILRYYAEWLKGHKDAWRQWEIKERQEANSIP